MTTLPDPVDDTQFRRALQQLLVAARENGLTVCNQSWLCSAPASERAWDVEITTVERSRED